MDYSDKTTMRPALGTDALAGQAGKLLAKGRSVKRELQSAIGERYWASADTSIQDNLESQASNFVQLHTAHAKEWAAELANLTADLNAANKKLAAAEALDADDKKRASKVQKAEKAQRAAIRGMDKWLAKHDSTPVEKVASMFEFKLGGIAAAKKLEKVQAAAAGALTKLNTTYAQDIKTGITAAQTAVIDAVKAAVAAGWSAEGLANRNVYGLA